MYLCIWDDLFKLLTVDGRYGICTTFDEKNPNKQCLVWRHARWISFACSFFPPKIVSLKTSMRNLLQSSKFLLRLFFFLKPCNIIVHIGLDRSLSLYVNSSLYYIHSLFILLLRFFFYFSKLKPSKFRSLL